MSLENVKEGDPVLVSDRGSRRKDVAGRCTRTLVTIGGVKFTRRGNKLGVARRLWVLGTWARPWSPSDESSLVGHEAKETVSDG